MILNDIGGKLTVINTAYNSEEKSTPLLYASLPILHYRCLEVAPFVSFNSRF